MHTQLETSARNSSRAVAHIRNTILSTAALVLAGSAASAFPVTPAHLSNGATILQSANGIPMMVNPGGVQQATGHQQRIKSPDEDVPYCGNVPPHLPWGPYISWDGFALSAGSAFAYECTAAKTKRVREIDLPLAAIDAQNYGYSAEVDLYSDNNGTPGTRLDGNDVKAAQTAIGPCCVLTTVTLNNKPQIIAGTRYWFVVTPDKNSYLAWQLEDMDFVHTETMAENTGSGWEASTSPWYAPAVAIK